MCYVEASSPNGIKKALELAKREGYRFRTLLIKPDDCPAIFKNSPPTLTEGSWATMKRGFYRGDLVFVESISVDREKASVWLVPQIDMRLGPKRKGTRSTARPPQASFDPTVISTHFGPRKVIIDPQHGDTFIFNDKSYKNGLMQIDVALDSLSVQYTYNRAEFQHFRAASHIPRPCIIAFLSTIDALAIQTGDRVKVVAGQQQGLVGRVLDINGDSMHVGSEDSSRLTISIPSTCVQKAFRIGDTVKLLDGEHAGRWGMVTRADETRALVILLQEVKNDLIEVRGGGGSSDCSTLIVSYSDH